MPIHSAKQIDFDHEERHSARQERHRHTRAANDPALLMPPLFAMTWVPAWFIPVFFTGSRSNFG